MKAARSFDVPKKLQKVCQESTENESSPTHYVTALNANVDTWRKVKIHATQTYVRDEKASDAWPSSRWGHSWCMINDHDVVMVGGQGDKHVLCKDALWQLNLVDRKWLVPDLVMTNIKPEARTGHSTVYNPMMRCMYVFGGSKNKKWYSDVFMVDPVSWSWECVQATGTAPTRAYHSCTLFGQEMWVFGGVFPRPNLLPDGCSNDIFVFSLVEQLWYQPLVMGTKPCPRSGHSATLFHNRLVVFGGWDSPVCFNDTHILDLGLVEWSKPEVKGTPPSPRSWHASCALSGNRLFIHGGYNGNVALADSFIFHLDTLTWTEVIIAPAIAARTGHTAVYLPSHFDSRYHDNVLLFGGGDNEGIFFNDLFGLSIPTPDCPDDENNCPSETSNLQIK